MKCNTILYFTVFTYWSNKCSLCKRLYLFIFKSYQPQNIYGISIGTCPKKTVKVLLWVYGHFILEWIYCKNYIVKTNTSTYIHTLGRSFYPEWLTVHSSFTFCHAMSSLGTELLTLLLLTSSQYSVAELQEHRKMPDRDYTILFPSQKYSASTVSAEFQWLFISKTRTNHSQCLIQSLKVSR